jgi:sugar transferase (PEP-CTERM/EpsH1 system associated)
MSLAIGSSVAKVLFLAHRIPYPPNKGDKIRSFHLLRHLAGRHRVFLGGFVDDPDDWQHRGALEAMCAEVFLRPLSPRLATARSARGLLNGEALTLPYYRDGGLRTWVDATMERERIEHVVVYCSSMAQYVDEQRYAHCRRVLDVVDVDSDKWRQYADRRPFPFSWIYRREARTLLAYERDVAARFDATLFVSAAEAALFRRLAPEVATKIGHYNNGVDIEYFDPAVSIEPPYPQGGAVVVFTGAMDYWANVDAVRFSPPCERSVPICAFTSSAANPARRFERSGIDPASS